MTVGTLLLLRHGESEWNAKNLFTGWVDVGLTDKGRAEAAARRRAAASSTTLLPDVLHTSLLRRAIATAQDALDAVRPALDPGPPVPGGSTSGTTATCRARTRPRSGSSTARSSSWSGGAPTTPRRRRSPTTPSSRRPATRATPACAPEIVPRTECLKDVVDRMLPYWYDAIVPDLRSGATVLVAAHGNSLRALVKHLDGIADEDDRRAQHPDRDPAALRPRRRAAPDHDRAGRTSTPRPPRTRSRRSRTRAADRTVSRWRACSPSDGSVSARGRCRDRLVRERGGVVGLDDRHRHGDAARVGEAEVHQHVRPLRGRGGRRDLEAWARCRRAGGAPKATGMPGSSCTADPAAGRADRAERRGDAGERVGPAAVVDQRDDEVAGGAAGGARRDGQRRLLRGRGRARGGRR